MIKVLHIFDMNEFHAKIKSVIYETVIKENESTELKSFLYAPNYIKKNKYIIGKNTTLEDILKNYSIDIVVFHSLYKKEYLRFYKILKKKEVPYLIRPHGSFAKKVMERNKLKKLFFNYFFFNNFIKNAFGIIYLNNEELENSYFKTNNNFLIPNMIEVNNKCIDIYKNKIANNKIIITYIGKFDLYYKNIIFMLKVMEETVKARKDVIFYLYGPKNKKEQYLYEKYFKENENIVYKGEIYSEEKENVFLDTDIFILLSISEGMPLVILEALSYGVPCFVSKNTNMNQILREYNAGEGTELNFENTVIKLDSFINKYLNNKYYYKKNAIKLAQERFSWDIKKFYEVYASVLNMCKGKK